MIEKSTTRMRLCPSCANSVQEDAAKCAYCKVDLLSHYAPEWLNRDQSSSEPRVGPDGKKKFSIPSKFIWPAAMLLVALTAFLAGGYIQRNEQLLTSQASLKQLQAKDQAIQSQEAQLAQTRQQLNDNSNKLAEMKTKLDESQKELSATQQRLGVATREANRLDASRSVAARRTASRAPDTAAPLPAPAAARRTAESGVYETTQATSVYENPSSGARVITQIAKGTRINVVSSTGDWLEVRSKHGNPPGYVRSDDARLMAERAEKPDEARPASRSSRRS
jgi:Bacterial SH3 domain